MFFNPANTCEVDKLIRSLPNIKSAGYDQINNVLLKELHPVIVEPLTAIFNKSLLEETFPARMKQADTVTLYKAKEKFLVNNYRPISLLLTLSKLLGKLVHSRTYHFLESHQILYNSQYGFRPNHPCENAISELSANIIKGIDKNEHTIALFLDLSKVFDTLNHDILLSKSELYGICSNVLNWYRSYFKDRTLRVKIKTNEGFVYSSEQTISYGAPQGSVLGPLLFIIFTNDIYQHLENADGILFADDTTLYKMGKNENYTRWCIEHDLEILTDWFKANKLTVNLNKTVAMKFGKNRNKSQLKISGYPIPWVDKTKFLGLWLDNDPSWKVHIKNLCLRLKCNMYLLCDPKNLFDRFALKMIYHAHIQSHVNYGLLLWGNSVNKSLLNKVTVLQVGND